MGVDIKLGALTIDRDSNSLTQNEPIFALEGRNFSKGVETEVRRTNTLKWLLIDKLDFEAICLCNSQEHSCARVALQKKNRNMLMRLWSK